jgi:hypothetical protein
VKIFLPKLSAFPHLSISLEYRFLTGSEKIAQEKLFIVVVVVVVVVVVGEIVHS